MLARLCCPALSPSTHRHQKTPVTIMAKDKSKKKQKITYTAKTADRYELYQLSVQSVEPDVKFLRRVYKKEFGQPARHMREDFCGTGLMTAYWIKRGPEFTAEGFDIDPEPLAWGKARHFAKLGDAAERAIMHQADVREASVKSPDVRCAQNFSYCVFKSRDEMLHYFKSVHADLANKGVFVMDIYGGPEAFQELEEETDIDEGFTYVWDQDDFSPVTHDARMYIHFRFEDGTEMSKAFTYEWRVWTIPELSELLNSAGFSRVDIYWEGTDEDGESGNGIYRKTKYGEPDISFVSYIVAIK